MHLCQRVTKGGDGCEICPSDAFQPEENDSQVCKACTKCESSTGSVVKEECTKETDTKCQCRDDFVPWESDSSSCKCKDGHFTYNVNSQCKKWKECKCGVKRNGTRSSDVICHAEFQGCSASNIPTPSSNYLTTLPTSNKTVSLLTRLTSPHPRDGAHTPRMPTGTTATAAPGHKVIQLLTGLALVMLGIFGLLVVTAVTCKLHFTLHPAAPKKDSLCRRPVEESGGSLCSVKLNPGED
ncbi:uncharacterized protein AB9W97_006906 isoform 2-T2 [Spinachia spinachia]